MRTKAEIAAEDYHGNFNCAQSTFAVFAEDYGLDEKDALRIASAFGGGCHYGGTCGAVTGAAAVIGLKYGNIVSDPDIYMQCREKVREFMDIFRDEHGAINCSDLLGIDMADPGGRDRAKEMGLFETQCHDYIKFAVKTLEELGY
jgi:C_GCAxxG_C_C family probable redox protein